MVRIRFDDTPFRASHGKAPRGRGSWAFQIETLNPVLFSPSMPLADARKWAAEKARTTVVPNLHATVKEIWISILP